MPCPQDAKSAAIRGQNDLACTKVRAAIILTSYFCAFGTIIDPVYEFMTSNRTARGVDGQPPSPTTTKGAQLVGWALMPPCRSRASMDWRSASARPISG